MSSIMPHVTLEALLQYVIVALELVGIAAIVTAGIVAGAIFFRNGMRHGSWASEVADFRAGLGRGLLIGLEFLIAADIIKTVTLEPTLTNLGILAGVVAIRTLLSISIEVEIEGRWPWRHAASSEKSGGKG